MTGPRPDMMSGLAALIQGFSALRDPNRMRRQELMQRIQNDPEFAQQLRDNPQLLQMYEKELEGPRFLKGLGQRDNFAQYIRNMPMSPEAIERQKIQGSQAFEMMKGAQLPGMGLANIAGGMMGNTPEAQTKLDEWRELNKFAKTPQTREYEGQRLSNAKQEGELNTLQIEGAKFNLEDAKAQKTERERLKGIRTDTLKELKTSNLFEAVMSGKLSPDQIQALYDDPGIAKAIDDQRMLWAQKAEFSLRRELANRDRDTEFDPQRILTQQAAVTASRYASKIPGLNFMDAYELQSNPGTQALLDRVTDPNVLDPKHRKLYDAYTKMKEYDTKLTKEEKQESALKFYNNYKSFFGKDHNPKPEEADFLNAAAQAAGIDAVFSYKEGPLFLRNKIEVETTDPALRTVFRESVKGELKPSADDATSKKSKRWNELAAKYPNKSDEEITRLVEAEFKARGK